MNKKKLPVGILKFLYRPVSQIRQLLAEPPPIQVSQVESQTLHTLPASTQLPMGHPVISEIH